MLAGDYVDLIDLPKLSASKIYLVLELLAYLEIDAGFNYVSTRFNQAIDKIGIKFLSNVSYQAATCLDKYRDGWKTVSKIAFKSVASAIEQFSVAPGFHELSHTDLCNLAMSVEKDKPPETFLESLNKGFLNFKVQRKCGEIIVSVAADSAHPFAFKFKNSKVCIAGLAIQITLKTNQDGNTAVTLPSRMISECVCHIHVKIYPPNPDLQVSARSRG